MSAPAAGWRSRCAQAVLSSPGGMAPAPAKDAMHERIRPNECIHQNFTGCLAYEHASMHCARSCTPWQKQFLTRLTHKAVLPPHHDKHQQQTHYTCLAAEAHPYLPCLLSLLRFFPTRRSTSHRCTKQLLPVLLSAACLAQWCMRQLQHQLQHRLALHDPRSLKATLPRCSHLQEKHSRLQWLPGALHCRALQLL